MRTRDPGLEDDAPQIEGVAARFGTGNTLRGSARVDRKRKIRITVETERVLTIRGCPSRDWISQCAAGAEAALSDRIHLLDQTLRCMYEAISFREGEEPDWGRIKAVFLPNARLTRVTPEGIEYFDLETFQAMAMEMLDRGVYTSFFEQEVARKAEVFGALAHVLSAYETKRSPIARGCLARGVNSIQLLWNGQSWRVLSLLWDEETERNPLDLRQVFDKEAIRGENP